MNIAKLALHRAAAGTLLAAIAVAGPLGCGYTIRGVVSEGEMSFMQWAGADAPAPGRPIAGATVILVRDPTSMRPTQVAQATSGPDGTFTMSVDAFGAGWMDESWLFRASKSRVGSAELIDRLPGSPGSRTLVITLGGAGDAAIPWRGSFDQRESGQSLMEEAKRHW